MDADRELFDRLVRMATAHNANGNARGEEEAARNEWKLVRQLADGERPSVIGNALQVAGEPVLTHSALPMRFHREIRARSTGSPPGPPPILRDAPGRSAPR